MRIATKILEYSDMTTGEITLLVKNRFETTLGQRVHVASVRPEGSNGWAVFVEVDGIVWRQRVSREGELGTCTAISTDRRKPIERHPLPGFH
jgi:hypothetical protein